jgi:hypothetical protein
MRRPGLRRLVVSKIHAKLKLSANVHKAIHMEKLLPAIAVLTALQAAGILQPIVLVHVIAADRAALLLWVNLLVLIQVMAIRLAHKIILLQEFLVLRIRNARDLGRIQAARLFLNINYQ